MGTHATIHFVERERIIATVFTHYDGYPELPGVGADLYYMFRNYSVGCGGSGDIESYANGMGCLAAQYVAAFKKGVGGIYLIASPNMPIPLLSNTGYLDPEGVEAVSKYDILHEGAEFVYFLYLIPSQRFPMIAVYGAVEELMFQGLVSQMPRRFKYPKNDPRIADSLAKRVPADRIQVITVGARAV